MKPLDTQMGEQDNWDFSLALSYKENPMDKYSVKGSQFEQPLLEFSGACAGCGETAYAKLMTQLYGDRMYLANARLGARRLPVFLTQRIKRVMAPHGAIPCLKITRSSPSVWFSR